MKDVNVNNGVNKVLHKVTIPKQLQKKGFRFIKVKKGDKIPIEEWKSENYRYGYDNQKLLKWLDQGGNYGIVCGYEDLIILDFDNLSDEFIEKVKNELGKTLTVRSGSGLGAHLYYLVPGWGKKLVLENDEIKKYVRNPKEHKNPQLEIRSGEHMVIGPNSIHPSGGVYKIIDDSDIAYVRYSDFLSFLESLGYKSNTGGKTIDNWIAEQKEQWIVKQGVTIEKVLEKYNINLPIHSGTRLQGPHPIHGSPTTGRNFAVDTEKNVWHCFRHDSGGGVLSLIAMLEGLVKCEEMSDIDGHKKRLIDDPLKYNKLLTIIKNKFGVERKFESRVFQLKKARYVADLMLGTGASMSTVFKLWIVEINKGNPVVLLTAPGVRVTGRMKITTKENIKVIDYAPLKIGKSGAEKLVKEFGISLKGVSGGDEWEAILDHLDEMDRFFVLEDIVKGEDEDPFSLDAWGSKAIDLWKQKPYTYNATLKTFYIWNEAAGAYKPVEEEEILGDMIPFISKSGPIAALTEVRNKLLAAMKIHGTRIRLSDISKYWVIFRDKIVDAKTGNAVDVDKKQYFITTALPWKLRTDVTDDDWKNIRKLLKDWTSSEKDYEFLLDWLAYNLLPNNMLRGFLIVYGPKRTGKSQLQFLIRRLVGQESFATITPGLFTGDDRFGMWPLLNKLAVGLSELDEGVVFKTDRLKALVAGDPMSIEKKYGGTITAIVPVKITIFTNYLPEFNNLDDALVDRMHLLNFANKFSIGPSPVEAISDEEFEAFASYLATKVLPELLKRAYFKGAKTDEQRLSEYIRQTMPGIAFLNEACIIDMADSEAVVSVGEFMDRFSEWFMSKYPGKRLPRWNRIKGQITKMLGRENVSVLATVNSITARYIYGIRFRDIEKKKPAGQQVILDKYSN